MSIFSQWAMRVFEAINVWYAAGFKVIKPSGDVAWGVNRQGYMAVGHETASYPAHIVTAAGSSLGVLITDRSSFWLALGHGVGNGVAAVQSTGGPLALMVNGIVGARANTSGMSVGTATSSATLHVGGDVRMDTWLTLPDPTTIYVASGQITPTQSYHIVDTENTVAADEVYIINSPAMGRVLYLRSANDARDITFIDNTTGSNLRVSGSPVLSDADDMVTFIGNPGIWFQQGFSDNA